MLPMCFWGVFVEMYIVSLFYYPNDSFFRAHFLRTWG